MWVRLPPRAPVFLSQLLELRSFNARQVCPPNACQAASFHPLGVQLSPKCARTPGRLNTASSAMIADFQLARKIATSGLKDSGVQSAPTVKRPENLAEG